MAVREEILHGVKEYLERLEQEEFPDSAWSKANDLLARLSAAMDSESDQEIQASLDALRKALPIPPPEMPRGIPIHRIGIRSVKIPRDFDEQRRPILLKTNRIIAKKDGSTDPAERKDS